MFIDPDISCLDWPVFVRWAEWAVLKKGSSWGPVHTRDCIVLMNLYGVLKIIIDRKEYRLTKPGEVIILGPGSTYSYRCESEFHACRTVFLNGTSIKQFLTTSGLSANLLVYPSDFGYVKDLQVHIYRYCERQKRGSQQQASATAYELLLYLSKSLGKPVPRVISEAIDYISSRLYDPIDNEDIARAAGISRSRLCTLFREIFSESPLTYRRKRRIEIAKNMLGKLPKSIKEISADLGYNSQHEFAREFKKQLGVSPTMYRDTLASEEMRHGASLDVFQHLSDSKAFPSIEPIKKHTRL